MIKINSVTKKYDDFTAVENINIENAYNGNVYNMQGILVIKNANAEQINTLPAGLYIVNGKKVIRK